MINIIGMKEQNYEDLRKLSREIGADLFGVAHTERIEKFIDPEIKPQTDKMPFVISIGIRLQKAVLQTLTDRPNQIYKTHYRQVNFSLDHITGELARHIQNQGFLAMPIAASFIVNWQKQTAHVSHRHVGLEAGLGFWGKNNLLIHPKFGAGIRLSSIFTDMPIKTDDPVPNDCGKCLACMMACPADAITENGFDFQKCYTKIREFSKQNNYNLLICGLCVKACADERS
jgi:epoxyqueuosine reductase